MILCQTSCAFHTRCPWRSSGCPFFGLDQRWAASLFFGSSSGLLAYGILRSDAPWRLLVFVSFPYLYALLFAQWSPLIMAAWFFPVLAPLLVLVKPQIALPIAINRITRSGVILAGAVLALSLLIYPMWPLRWRAMLGEFQSLVPLLSFPFGPLLLLALFHQRDERGRLLLAMAVLPFRAVYDLLALWLLPSNLRQALMLTVLSYLVVLLNFDGLAVVRPHWAVPVLFLPALAMLFVSHGRVSLFSVWVASKQ